jgi:predicted HTH domain antitoxin
MNKFNAELFEVPVTVTTRVDDELAKELDEVAKREGMDRSTVIRRFLTRALRDWRIDGSLKDYEEGRTTLWQAASRCGLSLWEMIDEVRKREVRVPYTLDELKEDLKGLGWEA